MTTPAPHNRVKSLLGSVGVGERIAIGKPHTKGYRLTVGRTVSGTQARFWLGHHEGEAQQRAQAVVALWGDMASAGRTLWTPDLIDAAKKLGEQKVAMLRNVATAFRAEANARDVNALVYRSRVSDVIGVPRASRVQV